MLGLIIAAGITGFITVIGLIIHDGLEVSQDKYNQIAKYQVDFPEIQPLVKRFFEDKAISNLEYESILKRIKEIQNAKLLNISERPS